MTVQPRKLPDAQLEALFDYLPMVVFYSKDRDGVFTGCNRHFEELHGLSPGGAIGLTNYDLHSPEIASRYRAEDCRVMESGAPVPNQVWMVPDANGVLRWWRSQCGWGFTTRACWGKNSANWRGLRRGATGSGCAS